MMIGTPPFPTAVGSPAGHSRPSVSALYPPHYDVGGGASCPIWDSRVGHFLWQEQEGRPAPEQRSAAGEQVESAETAGDGYNKPSARARSTACRRLWTASFR